jgi:hypothetical protein
MEATQSGSAQAVSPGETPSGVPVRHWLLEAAPSFTMDLIDRREVGMAAVEVTPITTTDPAREASLSAFFEVSNFGDELHVPVAHIHLGSGELAFSVFARPGGGLLLRPERGVVFEGVQVDSVSCFSVRQTDQEG